MERSMFTVLKKEIKDAVRDRRTLFTVLFVPLILYPVLFYFMGTTGNDLTKELNENNYIALVNDEKTSFNKYLEDSDLVEVREVFNIKKAIDDNIIYSAIEIPINFDNLIKDGKSAEIKIHYDSKSQKSSSSANILRDLLNDYSDAIVKERIGEVGLDYSFINPIEIERVPIHNTGDDFIAIFIPMLLPMMILITCFTSLMSSAIDVGAGEKERGTLESLLITPINRSALIFGKILSVSILGTMSTFAMLVGLGISAILSPGFFTNGKEVIDSNAFSISLTSIITIWLSVLLITIMLGSLQLAVSFYSRSIKEAQSYLTFLMFLYYFPVFSLYTLDVKSLKQIHYHIPVANIMAIIKEAFAGINEFSHIFIVFSWNIVYIMISISIVKFLFTRENVIFRV